MLLRQIILILCAVILFCEGSFAKNEKFPEMSLFHLNAEWKSDSGKTVKLQDLKGQVSVVAMVYTSCQHTCPMIVSKIEDIKRKLPKNISKKIKIVLISFDPKRDTPSALKKYKEKRKLNDQWLFLTGSDSGVRSLAAILGVNYKEEGEGVFSHSNIISVLDKKGVVVERMDSLQYPVDGVVKKIIKAFN